jgi:uncharacterized membrane protein YbaN (DUF454 family)
MKTKMLSWLFNGLGGFFLLLGVAGIFLPLLPTTPFLLLSGFFFSKGSPRFHTWLMNHKHLGPPIQDWKRKGVIRKPTKLLASTMLLISALVILPKATVPTIGKISFSFVAIGVLVFIWTRPSK